MKKIFLNFCLIVFLAWGGTALALPCLQLDVSSGFYNPESSVPAYDPNYNEETVVAGNNPFTLYALLDPTKISPAGLFYISIAVWPAVTDGPPGPDLGSFIFGGKNIGVTSDMVMGTPPIMDVDKDLQSHGVFETYFTEIPFKFDQSNQVGEYNAQDEPASFGTHLPSTGLYYAAFDVDVTNLSSEYSLHFDLYNIIETVKGNNTKTEIGDFAPFSHDAQSGQFDDEGGGGGGGDPVPEPATMLLLGIGMVGLAVTCRKKFIK